MEKVKSINSLKIGQTYEFNVLRTKDNYTIVGDKYEMTHYLPFNLSNYQKVDLKILEKKKGRIKFDIAPQLLKTYEINGVYEFETDGMYEQQLEEGGIHLIKLITPYGLNATVKAYDWQLSKYYKLPPKIKCVINDIDNNTFFLYQHIDDDVKHPYFEINKCYDFEFNSIKKLKDSIINLLLIKGEDGVEYTTKAHFFQRSQNNVKTIIRCRFEGIDYNGNTLLTQISTGFISFTDVFNEPEQKLYDLIEDYEGDLTSKLLSDYKNKENIWIFSFCEMLEKKIQNSINNYNYEKIRYLINYLVKAEEWIIQSGFLTTFNSENRIATKRNVNAKLRYCNSILKSLNIIESYKIDHFINEANYCTSEIDEEYLDILCQIVRLTDRKVLSNKKIKEIIVNCNNNNILNENNYTSIIGLLNKRIGALQLELINAEQNSESLNHIYKDLCLLKYIMYLMNYKFINDGYRFIYASEYYRYLYKLNESKKPYFLLIYSLMKLNNINNDSVQDVIDFNWHSLEDENFIQRTIDEFSRLKSYISKFGESIENGTLAPNMEIKIKVIEQLREYTIVEFNGVNGIIPSSTLNAPIQKKHYKDYIIPIVVNKVFKEFNFFVGLSTSYKNEDDWLNLFKKDRSLSVKDFQDYYQEGDDIIGVIKNIDNEIGIFVQIGCLDGLIHRNEISYNRDLNIQDEFTVGDEIECKIIEINISESRISLSQKALEIEELKRNRKYIGQIVNITEYGFFIDLKPRLTGLLHYSKLNTNDDRIKKLRIKDLCLVTIGSIDKKNQNIELNSIYILNDDDIKNPNVIQLAYTDQIKSSHKLQNFKNHNKSKLRTSRDFQKGFLLRSIALVNDNIMTSIQYMELSKIYFSNNSSKHSYFADAYITYFKSIDEFEKSNSNEMSSKYVDDLIKNKKLLEVFPEVNSWITSMRILSKFGNSEKRTSETLLDYAYDTHIEHKNNSLSKLVLSNNLLITENKTTRLLNENKKKIVRYLRDDIYELNDITDDESSENIDPEAIEITKRINRGEDKVTEFKTTLINPVPNAKLKEQINRQEKILERVKNKGNTNAVEAILSRIRELKESVTSNVIKYSSMKAIVSFANTNGGCLIIGVEDDKNIFGLDTDFKSIKESDKLDGYRKLFDDIIYEYIGNDIQPLLQTKIVEINDKYIMKIDVKPSIDPVYLRKNELGESIAEIFVRGEASARRLDTEQSFRYFRNRNF